MKKKVIISAALTAALMLAGAVGGTLAWFTSESKTDVSITAGTVKVETAVELVGAYSLGVARTDGTFENGGTYALTNALLKLDKMTPGDSVVLKVAATNASNVNIKWRINANKSGELASGLKFKIYTDAELKTEAKKLGYWSDPTSDVNLGTYYVEIALPEEAGNEYQGKAAEIGLVVEAVQGNKVTATQVNAPVMGEHPTTEQVTQFTDSVLINTEEEFLQVNLQADTTIYVSGHRIYFGDEEITKEITINGNGHKLIWELRDSDCSDIHMSNPEAILTIKNCDMTASYSNSNGENQKTKGTWNAHDICFDCNTKLENVNSDVAIALSGGAGFTYNLKNVNINESYQKTALYGMWITPGCNVNIDGLTIKSSEPTGQSDFRGIKIDDQYHQNEIQNTVLNIANAKFTTASKSAILVKSKGHTTINASNLDISGVAKDQTNAVWADNDSGYATLDTITVTGCTAIVEP